MEQGNAPYAVYTDGCLTCEVETYDEAMDIVSDNESYNLKSEVKLNGETIYVTEDDNVVYRVTEQREGDSTIHFCYSRYEARYVYYDFKERYPDAVVSVSRLIMDDDGETMLSSKDWTEEIKKL